MVCLAGFGTHGRDWRALAAIFRHGAQPVVADRRRVHDAMVRPPSQAVDTRRLDDLGRRYPARAKGDAHDRRTVAHTRRIGSVRRERGRRPRFTAREWLLGVSPTHTLPA